MKLNKYLIIAIIFFIVLVLSILLYLGIKDNQEKKNIEAQQEAKENLIKETQEQIGGEIIKEGFNITFESGKDRVIITVTEEPFSENKEKAIEYLKNIGLNTCDISYIVLPARGINIDGDNNIKTDACSTGG